MSNFLTLGPSKINKFTFTDSIEFPKKAMTDTTLVSKKRGRRQLYTKRIASISLTYEVKVHLHCYFFTEAVNYIIEGITPDEISRYKKEKIKEVRSKTRRTESSKAPLTERAAAIWKQLPPRKAAKIFRDRVLNTRPIELAPFRDPNADFKKD